MPARNHPAASAHPGVQPLPLGVDAAVLEVLPRLRAALDGTGPALAPYAAGSIHAPLPDVDPAGLPADLALVVSTSGSTGLPKHTMLSAAALHASVHGTHEVLAGPGRWLLALPPYHVAGIQVLVRSVLGAGPPVVMDLTHGFTARGFVQAAQSMPFGDHPAYLSLVPAQLTRLLGHPGATAALARFDAVLCGGAATSPGLSERALAEGVPLVATYGMTETCGGCVYEGSPLPDVQVHIDNDRHVVLGGPTVAHGYLADPARTADHFHTDADGVRWFRTDDLGQIDDDGQLHITGRADDLINTGGVKVAPGPVEDALVRYLPGVRDAVVVGIPSARWGQAVAAAIVLEPSSPGGSDRPTPTLQDARAMLRGLLPDAALPQILHVVHAFPMRGPGKPDRAALAALLAEVAARG